MEAQKVNWSLDTQQAQYILNVLSARPYQEVAELVQVLMQQSNGNRPDLKTVETEGVA